MRSVVSWSITGKNKGKKYGFLVVWSFPFLKYSIVAAKRFKSDERNESREQQNSKSCMYCMYLDLLCIVYKFTYFLLIGVNLFNIILQEYNVSVFITNQMTSDPGASLSFQADPKKPIGQFCWYLSISASLDLSLFVSLSPFKIFKARLGLSKARKNPGRVVVFHVFFGASFFYWRFLSQLCPVS